MTFPKTRMTLDEAIARTIDGNPIVDSDAGRPASLATRMRDFATELLAPMECTEPAYGVPGHPHCAACCYGTLLVVTCAEDQAVVDAAKALDYAASLIESMEVAR